MNPGDIVVVDPPVDGAEWDIGIVKEIQGDEAAVYWLRAQCLYLDDKAKLVVRDYPRRLLTRLYGVEDVTP